MERAPVDDSVRPVDVALPVEVHEEPHHRTDVRLVHREALPAIVERGADPPELRHDRPPVQAQPVPHARLERLPAEVLACLPLLGQFLLDRVLSRDAGVVVAGLKEDVLPAHPLPAHERVGQRDLQRVPHVQLAGDVRRWVRDDEALARLIGVRVVQTLLLPRALPALLDALRTVPRLHLAIVGTGRGMTALDWARGPP
jgi:hypothetical protein